VRNAIGKLPDGERTIAWMYYIDGLSCLAISLRVYYSERHIRRFRNHARDEIVAT
jgi:DNA-binding transcriptional regulator LsrR (DeoR family)